MHWVKDSGAGTSYRYDSRGNLIRVANGLDQVVEERRYNLQDMPSLRRDGLGNETAYRYTLDGQIREAKRGKRENSPYKVLQSYEYNARGQITGITDGNGERIDYHLDTWGRITGVGFSDGVTEGYEYTPSGQISRTVNGNDGAIRYRYNSFGKIRERIDQTGDAETFQYDEEGNLSLHIDRDGRRISRTYNVFGNLICEKAVDENGENPVVTTCRYDSLGRLTHAVCNGHSYEYIYNDQGRLKEKRSGGRRLISYTYDRAGKITEITDPAGVTTHYEYDILGRISRISSPGGMEVRYRYDCLDRLEQIRYGNGIRTSYQYDADGSVSHLETRMGSDILLSFRYQYDGNGNRLMKTGIQGPATAGSSALDITYQYDVRGQLLEENRKDAVFRYSYDAAGNRIRKEETGENRNIETVYFYNEKNQLIHMEELPENGSRRRNTFTYSKQGSILREETESGISRYFYNSKNQQIRVERADGQIQENRYDAEGLRHEMRENEKLLRFVYQNGELLYEEGGDKETASCHLGAGIEAVRRGQRTYYCHPDEQLSTALITDETGMIKNQYRYDAFGAGLEVSEELPNRIRYTGQQYDEVTEQYYLRARYYNPILGRFLQEDVCQGDGLNLYAYCRNNPVVYYDPSGYNKISCSSDKIDDGSGKKNTDNKFPERTPEAQAEAQRAVNVGNALKAFSDYDPDSEFENRSQATAVFLHEGGDVSVGISGEARGNRINNEYAKQLENALNESAGEKRYTVSSITDDDLMMDIAQAERNAKFPKAGQNVPGRGDCAEPKAASAAHQNDNPIIGFDVRHYNGNGDGNRYPLENADSPNQMRVCDRCGFNEEVYMNYANNKKQDS